jgi:hypothetical protein
MGAARSLAAVAAGVIGWSILWVAGGAAFQAASLVTPGARVDDPVLLWGLVAFSVVLSLAAGALVGALARKPKATAHALAAGAVLLGLGLWFEISAWALTPVWYHVIFLVLLVPACVAGSRLVARSG